MERRFYQLSPAERLRVIARKTRLSSADEGFLDRLLKSAESLEAIWIENQVGFMTVPLGVIPRIVVNRRPHAVPLATEEPGIIAAIEYAAEHCIQSDGFTCTHLDDVIRGQIVYHGRDDFGDILEAVQKWGPEIIDGRTSDICRFAGPLGAW